MPLELTFRCPLPNGLHARPASCLSEVAARFQSEVGLRNDRTGVLANAKSALSLIGADARLDDPCALQITGPDEEHALAELTRFVNDELPGCDEPLPVVAETGQARVPRPLAALELRYLTGTPLSHGLGWGRAVVVGGVTIAPEALQVPEGGADCEATKAREAISVVAASLHAQIGAGGAVAEGIIKAQHALLTDPELAQAIVAEVEQQGIAAGQAILNVVKRLSAQLQATGNDYLKERAADLKDLGFQLLRHLYGDAVSEPEVVLTEPSIVVAADLAPRQLLALDRSLLAALVLETDARTSHTAILARSFGIPTLSGVEGASQRLVDGQELIVDATRGIAVTEIDAAVKRFYDRDRATRRRRHESLMASAAADAVTLDGRKLEVAANIATDVEAVAALENGADAVGLFRTEMLFLDRPAAPSEEEQYEVYRAAVQAMQGRPVIIRTLDIGGDKPAPFLGIPPEENPFLGYRGIRIYEEFDGIVGDQLRAILRAAAHGPVKLMAPMVCTVAEGRWLKDRVARAAAELDAAGVAHGAVQVGAMIETPAAALMVDALCSVLDFFSIGTNDLFQYTFAADRGNARVATRFGDCQPGFFRLLKQVADAAHAHGRWVGLCGELAQNAEVLPLLIGLGLDEISMPARDIAGVKAAVRGFRYDACREALERAVACAEPAELRETAQAVAQAATAMPLLADDLILVDADCASKEEIIRTLSDALYVAGRTANADDLEEAIWNREATYSTGLGHGFAIPHCKVDAVTANTVAVIRVKEPVEWGAIDDKPVQVAILLATRASSPDNTHMKVFSRLARKLMHDEFRDTIMAATRGADLLSYLEEQLEIPNTR